MRRTFHLTRDDKNGYFSIDCKVDGVLAGHVIVSGDDRYELESPNGAPGLIVERLEVFPLYLRQGIGTQLLNKALNRFIRVFWDKYDLFLRAQPIGDCIELEPLIKFYERHGFVVANREDTSVTMWWNIGE